MTPDLFDEITAHAGSTQSAAALCITPGAVLLRGYALTQADTLLQALAAVLSEAPLRHLITPGGYTMSVAMTNCGALGWVSSRSGYRYSALDPQTQRAWPAMPPGWLTLAKAAAAHAGYPHFEPDACLVNQYAVGAKLSLHQDRDEADAAAPIVSVSFGLPAVFLFGGPARSDRTQQVPLQHGDVVVFGGPARLAFHGVKPLADGTHPLLGKRRVNLTFRQAQRAYGSHQGPSPGSDSGPQQPYRPLTLDQHPRACQRRQSACKNRSLYWIRQCSAS